MVSLGHSELVVQDCYWIAWPALVWVQSSNNIRVKSTFQCNIVNLRYDLDLGFSRSNFERAVSWEWENRLTWNERDVSWKEVGPTMWPWPLTLPVILDLDFQVWIFKLPYLRNGWVNWLGTKGMWVWYDVWPIMQCDMGLPIGYSKIIHWPSTYNGLM